jgi:putative PIN family toxin of toxin-antitoxin system
MQQIHPARQSHVPLTGLSVAAEVLVIDTNVVLDLLVFGDPASSRLASRLTSCASRWHATEAMRCEFEAVLARPKFDRHFAVRHGAMDRWHAWTQMVDPVSAALNRLACRDRDDQMFVDLAVQLSPSCLLTWDKEVLRLQRPAKNLGVRIVTPAQYCNS